jgi:hypothetical protein
MKFPPAHLDLESEVKEAVTVKRLSA